MNRRRERQTTLGIASVIITALLITVLYFAIAITGFEKSKGAEVAPKAPRPSRPQLCHDLYNVDRHKEWAECMGVGYK